ncbi:MAG: DUF115 domain-containing protein [Treponema sp.]|nr:DUF115 domain-containing protein [Treponema sp.]
MTNPAAAWETNREILAKQYPGLLDEINAKTDNILPPEDIQIDSSSAGEPTLKVRGVFVHSQRDPVREGQRLAESIAAAAGPVVILGFGLGYAAQAAAALSPGRPLIIVEKYRNLLSMAFELRDFSKLLRRNNVVFTFGGDGAVAALSLFSENAEEKPAPAIIPNRALFNLDEEWYGTIENRIRTWAAKDNVNRATHKRFGRRWVRNLSRNMDAIRDLPGISALEGIADSAPVFLAAAGPSLDLLREHLPEIHRRCIVIAVDTSLRFFVKNGVHPDFVLIVDPQFWNSRHLDRCAQICAQHTCLVAESAVYPPVLKLPFKRRYLCGSLFPLGEFIEKRVDPKGRLGAGGSVATTAWDFARHLGAKQIWLAGLDLAFPGLKTHFRGALFEEISLSESHRTKPAETWLLRALRDGLPFSAPSTSGGQVLTDRRLSLYAAWFENRFSQHPEISNYSLFSGGLAINGLESKNIEDLIALPVRRGEIDERLETIFAHIEASFFKPQEKNARDERYKKAVSTLLGGLQRVKTAAERGKATAEKALKTRPNPIERDKILKIMDEVARIIANSEVKEAAGFLFPPAESAETEGKEGDPFNIFLKSSAALYRSLAQAVEANLGELEGK